jgi:hypothetical protein
LICPAGPYGGPSAARSASFAVQKSGGLDHAKVLQWRKHLESTMMTPDKSGTSPRDEHTKTDIEAIKRELEDIRKERMELDQKENLILGPVFS